VFLVPFSIGEFNKLEAVAFVETPCAKVLLEDPELESVWTPIHRNLQERRAHSSVLVRPMHPQMPEGPLSEAGETNDTTGLLRDADFVVGEEHVLDEVLGLCIRVQLGEIGHATEGRLEDVCDGIGIA
jgi:hypothetical protein